MSEKKTRQPPNPAANQQSARVGRKSTLGGIAVLGLVALYAFARPTISERTGWDLPELRVDASGHVVTAGADQAVAPPLQPGDLESIELAPAAVQPPSPQVAEAQKKGSTADAGDVASSKLSPAKSTTASGTSKQGPLADRMRAQPKSTDSPANVPKSKGTTKADQSPADLSLKYGLLREIGNDRYQSPAGLVYAPGSAEGHRIEHVRRHTKDDPGRPGSHGVFDGGIEGALKTIDQAYEKAKAGQRTTKQEDDGRTIYTVDMGKRVGFVGGRDGGRKRNPMARRVMIVLEGNRVITAYPK